MGLREKLLASFDAEHREHLEAIRSLLSEAGDDATPNLAEAYRRAHSLKGAARAVDLAPVETLAHRLESLFSKVQEGAPLNGDTLTTIYAVVDAVEDWVAAFNKGEQPHEPTEALSLIEQWLNRISEEPEASAGAEDPAATDGETASDQDEEVAPQVDAAEPDTEMPATEQVPETAPEGRRDTASETLRIEAGQLDRLLRASGVLLEDGIRGEAVASEIRSLVDLVDSLERVTVQFRSRFGSMIRQLDESPEHRRLVSHMNDVDRQVRNLSRKAKAVSGQQDMVTWATRQHVADLQDEVIAARMVTAESLFVGFRKMVRDLVRDEGKEADVVLRGMNTVADRVVLQGLKDGIMHVLRNAVSHGLELPEDRERAGKPRKGRIVLDVSAHSGRIIVTVDDDGRGIDFDRVRESAVQRQLVEADAAASLDRARLCELLLQSGFSTAHAVTSISGRGVGLSAAVEAASRMQGRLEIPEKSGPGTTIVVSVPLRVSSHRVVFVSSGGETFGLLSSAIEKLLRVKPDDITLVDGQRTVQYEDDIIPLRSLAELVGLAGTEDGPAGSSVWVAVVNTGVRRVALSVSALLYVREAVVKELDGAVPGADLAVGAVLMPDGSVSLVLNVPALISAPLRQERKRTVNGGDGRADPATAEILVVDDSITTRTLERSILEAHGYRVRVSVDGLDALKAMREKLPDIVVSDVEMPRMDGLGLLREIKQDAHLSAIPVILVTSRDSEEDRSRGLALGANDYIVKGKFDQRNLLATIERLL